METSHYSGKLTYADYVQIPDDDLRHEIIDGVHFVSPSPATKHQRISGELFYALKAYLKMSPIGEVFAAPFDVLLSKFDIVVPDLVYVSSARKAQFLTDKNLQGAPDLAMEILSPSTKARDQRLKRDLYERVGVQEYWVVDADAEEIAVFRRGGASFESPRRYTASQMLTTPLLPGLEIRLTVIFKE